jgi:hypothetical protein
VLEELFELNIRPIPSTEPKSVAISVLAMIIHRVRNSVFNKVIENLKPAFVLNFCGGILHCATKHLLDDVSVDFAILSEQYFE